LELELFACLSPHRKDHANLSDPGTSSVTANKLVQYEKLRVGHTQHCLISHVRKMLDQVNSVSENLGVFKLLIVDDYLSEKWRMLRLQRNAVYMQSDNHRCSHLNWTFQMSP